MPNMATDAASSMPDIDTISVGMPLATPYPFVRKRNKHGTITAGLTAAIIDPNAKAHVHGIPKN